MSNYLADVRSITSSLRKLSSIWEGKQSILELKDLNYNWKQTEWWAFYFEYHAKRLIGNKLSIPGDKFKNVRFDLKGVINWDLKAKAVKSDDTKVILNDKQAMDQSIRREGAHGEIIALCDVEYNDVDRTFQKWHMKIKGGKSKYEIAREARTSISRYRKTRAELIEIVVLVLTKKVVDTLPIYAQGRNSNGSARKVKYMLDLEKIGSIERYKISF